MFTRPETRSMTWGRNPAHRDGYILPGDLDKSDALKVYDPSKFCVVVYEPRNQLITRRGRGIERRSRVRPPFPVSLCGLALYAPLDVWYVSRSLAWSRYFVCLVSRSAVLRQMQSQQPRTSYVGNSPGERFATGEKPTCKCIQAAIDLGEECSRQSRALRKPPRLCSDVPRWNVNRI